MIQRIQTLYLSLAAILLACTYFFKLWTADIANTDGTSTQLSLKIVEHLYLLTILAAAVILIFVTIFNFKNRSKQIKIGIVTMLACLSYNTALIFKITSLSKTQGASNPTYSLAMLLPIAALVLIVLAIYHIRKDDKLVKSLDRLR